MATTTIDPSAQAEIFSRVFDPDRRDTMTPAAARSILKLDFSPEDRERMNSLAAKARVGKLTKRQDSELETYIQVGHLLAIMQSKARKTLRKTASED